MVETEANVYFDIRTEDEFIEEDTINNYLGLKSTKFEKIHSRGTVPACTHWTISTNMTKNPNVSLLISDIINTLLLFKEKFIAFKKEHSDIEYIFEIVIYHGDHAQGFNMDNEQLNFLSDIGASVDVDQYNYKD